ncbi:hypothetical protein [uncultured Aquimarina sp.]|uniref:hypothetical protein n=1 Tax=uncultured Aquimarina sp. TaxID=575652 RepID=UPI002627B63F|nr:hypothetical protein [uncultured Aquimarina sp.]
MARLDIGTSIIEETEDGKLDHFSYKPLGVANTYGVLLISEDEKKKRLQIHYEIDVICLDETEDNHFEFEVLKHQIYINEKAPNILIDELSERCGKVLYPLLLKVNRQGLVVNILNQEDIIKRWETEKASINQSYKGKEIQLLLKNMDIVINNTNQLTDLVLQRDWFITIFFSPLYNINLKDKKKNKISLPFIPYSPGVIFETKNKISTHSHKKNDVIINQKGKCIDQRSERDILRGNLISIDKIKKVVKGKLDLKYQIYKDSLIADAITGICNLEFPSGKEKKMTVEIYNLKNKTPLSSVKRAALFEISEEEEKNISKKKKKRFFFFGK